LKVAELFVQMGIKTDEAKTQKFGKSIATLKMGLLGVIGVASAVAIALRKITNEAMESAVAFSQFETETGLSTDKLQQFEAVAKGANVSTQSLRNSLKSIVANQEKIKLGEGDISGYQLLGIDPNTDPFQLIRELREKTAGLSQGMKKNILSQMGISADMMQMIELSSEQFEELSSNAFIIPESNIKTLTDAKASINLMGQAIDWVKNLIATEFAPIMQKGAKQLTNWIKHNKELIQNGIKKLFDGLRQVITVVSRAVTLIANVIQNTIGWKNAMYLLIGVIALMNTALIFSPLGAFIAGIALLVLILEDLFTYSQGGDSLFGRMMKQFPELEKTILGSVQVLKDMFSLIKALFKGDQDDIDKFVEKMGTVGAVTVGVFEGVKFVFEALMAYLKEYFAIIGDVFNLLMTLIDAITGKKSWGEAWGDVKDIVLERKDSIVDTVGGLYDKGKAGVKQTQNAINITVNSKSDAKAEDIAKLTADEVEQAAAELGGD
jgi:hypothetical protein